jgi:hypothetical protein
MTKDYMTLQKFHEKFPDLHKSFASLKSEATKRRDNGLMDHKAIVEKRIGDTRPSLLISPSRYFDWLDDMQAEEDE